MYRVSTNVQVKANLEKEEFIKAISKIIKKRGFVQCSKNEATLSYVIAVKNSWATITNKDYTGDLGKASRDMTDITAALKTSAFALVTFGKVFAFLKFKDHKDSEDIVAVGNIAGREDCENEGKRELWEPLLAFGRTWDNFSELRYGEGSSEDELSHKIADVFGIDQGYIYADIGDLLDKANCDKSIISLYFKETDVKSLKNNFVEVFGNALEPLGFKKIKGKYPYFVRVLPGGEVIHIITYMEEWCPYPGQKKFNILSGIATVYRYKIDLDRSPDYNSAWLHTTSQIYSVITPEADYDNNYRLSICHFVSDEGKGIFVRDAVEKSLELTRRFAIPLLDTAVDLWTSIDYMKKTEQWCSTNSFTSRLEFDKYHEYDEGLLYVKINDEKLKDRFRKIIDGTTPSDEKKRQRVIDSNKFFDDPEIHEKVMSELEQRKNKNVEILKSYGLSFN